MKYVVLIMSMLAIFAGGYGIGTAGRLTVDVVLSGVIAMSGLFVFIIWNNETKEPNNKKNNEVRQYYIDILNK